MTVTVITWDTQIGNQFVGIKHTHALFLLFSTSPSYEYEAAFCIWNIISKDGSTVQMEFLEPSKCTKHAHGPMDHICYVNLGSPIGGGGGVGGGGEGGGEGLKE